MLNQIYNRHQRSTNDGGQAMGEKLRHVQMSRWSKHTGEAITLKQDFITKASSKGRRQCLFTQMGEVVT